VSVSEVQQGAHSANELRSTDKCVNDEMREKKGGKTRESCQCVLCMQIAVKEEGCQMFLMCTCAGGRARQVWWWNVWIERKDAKGSQDACR